MKKKYLYLIIVGVVSSVVGGLILSETDNLRNFLVKIISAVWSAVLFCWNALNSDFSLSGWWILTLGIFAIIGLITAIILLYALLQPATQPEYLNYTEDLIDGVRWRWSWSHGSITNLVCFCPICDAQLIFQDNYPSTDLFCERCNINQFDQLPPKFTARVQGDQNYVLGAAKREILRRVRTNHYPSY